MHYSSGLYCTDNKGKKHCIIIEVSPLTKENIKKAKKLLRMSGYIINKATLATEDIHVKGCDIHIKGCD